jgi:hypothetical protein
MGVVYRARQVGLGRTVALKMILTGGHAGEDERARFRTEAEAIARLQHPNIVQVFEVGEHEGKPFFSLEFCPGGSLDKRLDGTPWLPEQAAQLVETMARAMQAAHEVKVIHRDLKPANVLLADDGTPKVTDFGLAKKLDEGNATLSGTVLGTPSYMAPEQAGGRSRELGPACDVYALGAILYELLTGRPPFKAPTTLDTLRQVVADEPVPPSRLQSQTPRDLETICLKCLQKETGKRYPSAGALADDLARFQRGEPIQGRPVGRLERGVKWVRRNPTLAGLVTAVALSLVGGTVVSTRFALAANAKAREAERALAEVEESVAVGLLRPLGHIEDEPFNEFELATLEELASLPVERDRVRILFMERALDRPVTAGQLGRRLEEAVHAVVGLDPGRRAKVLAIVQQRLAEEKTPAEVKVVAARIVAELRAENPELLRQACTVLLVAMKTARESGKVSRRQVDGLAALVARLDHTVDAALLEQAVDEFPEISMVTSAAQSESKESVSAAETPIPTPEDTPGKAVSQVTTLLEELATSSDLELLIGIVRQGVEQAFSDQTDTLLRRLGLKRSVYDLQLYRALRMALRVQASRMSKVEATGIARAARDQLLHCEGSRCRCNLAVAFAQLADALPPAEAANAAEMAIDRAVLSLEGSHKGAETGTDSYVVASLVGLLEANAWTSMAPRLVRVGEKSTNPWVGLDIANALLAGADRHKHPGVRPQILQLLRKNMGSRPEGLDEEGLKVFWREHEVLVANLQQSEAVELLPNFLLGVAKEKEQDCRSQCFKALLVHLSDQQLTDLLKYPVCVGIWRQHVASVLGQRHGQEFKSLWEIVNWFQQQAPQMDLLTPPRMGGWSPQARRQPEPDPELKRVTPAE